MGIDGRSRSQTSNLGVYMSAPSYDQPISQLLRKALVNSEKYLSAEGVLSQLDKRAYPVPQTTSLTSRDLTVLLLKQHEFLANRAASLHFCTKTNEQQSVVVLLDRLKKERNGLSRQLQEARVRIQELESLLQQTENVQNLSDLRAQNSKLQQRLMLAEAQIKDQFKHECS